MQILAQQAQAMTIPFRPRRAPATHETEPVTPESIEKAKEAQRMERDDLTAKIGITFINDRPILPVPPVETDQMLACATALDAVIEEFGLDAVLRAAQLVAAMNGKRI